MTWWRVKYPLRTLSVGESMFFPGASPKNVCKARLRHAPMRFRVEAMTFNGVDGVRVTRMKDSVTPGKRGRIPRYPLRQMGVGDSLFAPDQTAQKMCTYWKLLKPLKFSAKTVIVGGVKGARVHRIA